MSPLARFGVGLCLALLALALRDESQPDAQARQDKGKQFALLIGVNEYKREPFTSLNFAENDVVKLAAVLKQSGFTVRVLTNTRGKQDRSDAPTAANIRAALKELIGKKSRNDTILIALSGHGVAVEVDDPDGKGKAKTFPFFCPHDADLANISYSKGGNDFLININDLFADLGTSGAGVKLVLMDACRDEMKAKGATRNIASTKVDVAKGIGALFSCSAEERAFESKPLGHGVFFHFVLKGLSGEAARDGQVTFDDLVSYVVGKVSDEVPALIGGGAKQTPDRIITYKGKSPVLARVATPKGPRDDLRRAIADLAEDVKKHLDAKKAGEVAIGKFDGPPSHKTAAGPGFTMILAEELAKAGIVVKEQAKFGIEGRYSLTEIPASDPDDARIGKKILGVKVKLDVVDAFDNRESIERTVKGEATLGRAFGVSAPLDPKNTEVENDKRLRETIIADPACHIDGSLVQSAKDQPFAIEVLVEGKGKPATEKDGLAFVDIKRGEVYAIRLINRAEHEVAVQLFIDGISIYAFSDLRAESGPRKGEPRYSSIIVPAGTKDKPGTAIVRGWHRTNKKGGEDSFLVTEYAKSAAAKLKRTEGLGTITATFQAAWEGDKAPKDEPGKRRGGLGDATGFGPPAGQGFREVARKLGVVRDCVTVRYTIPKGKE